MSAELERLRAENRQLHEAVTSHAVVDQAIGVLVALGRISPTDGFAVLRQVSQHTNIKLSALAECILQHGRNADLPGPVQTELLTALKERFVPTGLFDKSGDAAAWIR
ncbi:ANTAR domain-containing protein [Streptomyces anthocyanicus]|uniref:ANTAR domain-containing protein n=1 Tax=Streptomyces anthocyanicus TaxID=68174 RepID=UPI003873C77A|nr:ANTAR domain-containing protein [Streptomyces anthocyanicus]